MLKKVLIVFSLFIISCSDKTPAEEKNKNTQNNKSSISTDISPISSMSSEIKQNEYEPKFIKASELLKKINNNEDIYIFDVRNKLSYEEGHIKNAKLLSLPITEDMVKDISKSAEIITYCGCPHHLSSIGAEQLENLGYKNVRVLEEGYWYWKDKKYPIEVSKEYQSKVTHLKISGKVLKESKPLSNIDLYIKHDKTGQLEAARTKKDGSYTIDFHIYNYSKNDSFSIYLDNLSNPNKVFSVDKEINENIDVIVK
jgi:rhodanese-related sulfurtransferase